MSLVHAPLGRGGVWLACAALILSIIACTANVSSGRDDPSGSSDSGSGAGGSSGQADSPSGPAGAFFELSDPADDCFDGMDRLLTDCAGVDMTGLFIGQAADLPVFADEPIMAGRLGFVVTFADELASVESFQVCLYLNLDGDPATGDDLSRGFGGGIPGVDRGVCVTLPEAKTYFYYFKPDWDYMVDRHEPNYDDALAATVVSGSQVGVGIHPSLLGYATGDTPSGFVLQVGTARSIDSLDQLNDQGSLSQSQPIIVPDEVVTQILP
jgi:hypothetical protein